MRFHETLPSSLLVSDSSKLDYLTYFAGYENFPNLSVNKREMTLKIKP